MIIGVSGPNGAGKGAVIETLASLGFSVHSLSDVIRQTLAERGLTETRERMIEVGRELRAKGGTAALAEALADQLDSAANCAVDSIRHPAEVEALRRLHTGFQLVWVDAPMPLRFERMRVRGRPGDPATLEEMADFENRERSSAEEAGQQLGAVEQLADARLDNSGDVAALREAVSRLLGSGDSP